MVPAQTSCGGTADPGPLQNSWAREKVWEGNKVLERGKICLKSPSKVATALRTDSAPGTVGPQ